VWGLLVVLLPGGIVLIVLGRRDRDEAGVKGARPRR
jgi:hypothetical protein